MNTENANSQERGEFPDTAQRLQNTQHQSQSFKEEQGDKTSPCACERPWPHVVTAVLEPGLQSGAGQIGYVAAAGSLQVILMLAKA